jgi:hypothetical protein
VWTETVYPKVPTLHQLLNISLPLLPFIAEPNVSKNPYSPQHSVPAYDHKALKTLLQPLQASSKLSTCC